MGLTSSAIAVIRNEMVLLEEGILLRTDYGIELLTTSYASMNAGLMRSSVVVRGTQQLYEVGPVWQSKAQYCATR